MPSISLDDIRSGLKTADELNPDEIQVINDNKDQLNDEEKDAFKTVISREEEEQQQEQEAQEAQQTQEETQTQEPEKPTETIQTTPQENAFTFKTEADAKSFIEQAIADREAAKPKEDRLTPQEQKQEAKEEAKKFFDDKYQAADANTFINDLLNNPDFAEALVNKLGNKISPKVQEDIAKNAQAQRETIQKQQTEWDNQYKALIDDKKVPPILNTDGTTNEEGRKVNDSIAKLAQKYRINNYTDAYDLWSKVPEEHGGGLKVDAAKQKMAAQKSAASMAGRSQGAEASKPVKGQVDYKTLHEKSMDQLLADEL